MKRGFPRLGDVVCWLVTVKGVERQEAAVAREGGSMCEAG
jgi:hypothetical protein